MNHLKDERANRGIEASVLIRVYSRNGTLHCKIMSQFWDGLCLFQDARRMIITY